MGKLKICFIMLFLSCLVLHAQNSTDYKRIPIGSQSNILSSVAINPIQDNIIALHGGRGCPLFIYDWTKEAVIKQFELPAWPAGSAMDYSFDGKYLILEQLYYNDWSANKDKQASFAIYEAETGKLIKSFENYHSIKFIPNQAKVLALTGITIEIWNLENASKEKELTIDNSGFSTAVSPDGKYFAIPRRLDKKELKKYGAFNKDKAAIKFAAKYKHVIDIYDFASFSKITSIEEYYDFIYDLSFSHDGNELFCLQIPHDKAATGVGMRQSTVSVIEVEGWKPIRKGFVSRSTYQPDYKLSADKKYFAIISSGVRFPEIHIYDFESGKLEYRYELSHRMIEKSEGRLTVTDERTRFVFLPDNKSVILTMGNAIINWNFVK